MKKNEPTPNEQPQTTSAQLALADYLKKLTQGSVIAAQHCLTLPEIRQVVAAGEIAEISIAAFWEPRLSDAQEWQQGKMHAYAAPGEPLALYWQVGMHKHFCRPLTDDETRTFRELAKSASCDHGKGQTDEPRKGNTRRKFKLGSTYITPHARDRLVPSDVIACLRRHASCDWGDVCPEDRAENEFALQRYLRLFSVYHDSKGTKFWIITEADRSVTTVLLPDDY